MQSRLKSIETSGRSLILNTPNAACGVAECLIDVMSWHPGQLSPRGQQLTHLQSARVWPIHSFYQQALAKLRQPQMSHRLMSVSRHRGARAAHVFMTGIKCWLVAGIGMDCGHITSLNANSISQHLGHRGHNLSYRMRLKQRRRWHVNHCGLRRKQPSYQPVCKVLIPALFAPAARCLQTHRGC